MFTTVCDDLAAMGTLSLADRGIIAAYAQTWDEFLQATQTLAQEGRYIATAAGRQKSHPAVAQQRSALTLLKTLGVQLGLDPMSRQRLPAVAEPAANTAKLRFFGGGAT